MSAMFNRAMAHDGFSVIEVLSECVEFFPGAFDAGNPRKGGQFRIIEERTGDGSAEDAARHDVTDDLAAFRLADEPFPGLFGVFYEVQRPTKNALEQKWIDSTRAKSDGASDLDLLQATFNRMK
jgi:2-oxoglutarate ferredoxin oxidoreductase subunit beta